MSETHEPFTRFEFFPKPGFGVVGVADRFEHGNDRSRRPAVQRAFERSDRSRNGGDEIGSRGNNDPRRERGRVHAVINHRIQVRRERPYTVLAGDFAVQHVQQIGHMAETGVRFHWFFTVKKAPVGRYDSRQAGHQGPGVGRVVTGRQGGRGHSNHVDDGEAFLRRAAQQIEGNTGQWAARGQVPGELFKAGPVGQRSVPQQVDHLLVSRTFRNLLEWISPDDQYAGFPIDMAQPGFRRYDVLETG